MNDCFCGEHIDAIETVLEELEKYKIHNEKYMNGELFSAKQMKFVKKEYIPKKKIEHALEVCKNVFERELKTYQTEYGLDVTYLNKKEKEELINKRNCLITQMETYKQLLEDK